MTNGDRSRADDEVPGRRWFQDGGGGWYEDENLGRRRLADQLKIILTYLSDSVLSGSHANLEDATDRDYLYRRGVILVRDDDLDRVHAALGRSGSVRDRVQESFARGRGAGEDDNKDDVRAPMINGLTSYAVDDTEVALDRIDAELGVGVATPDHVLYLTPAGCCQATEPLDPGQSYPDPEVNRDLATWGDGVLVSVVDTGLLPSMVTPPRQPWLAGVYGDPENVVVAAPLRPYLGHGTFVSGVVRCQAPQAEVRVEAFLPNGGAVYESKIVRQLHDSLKYAPDIINLCAGTVTRKSLHLLSFQVFWETRLRHYKGTVLVAAAGNDGNRGPFWPAAFPWALSVGALEIDGERAPYSNFGSWVDIYARGTDVVNAFPDGEYIYKEAPNKGRTAVFDQGLARWSGTSFATPIVSGLIAARMSRTGESARDAATALKAMAVAHATAGVGPILRPGMA